MLRAICEVARDGGAVHGMAGDGRPAEAGPMDGIGTYHAAAVHARAQISALLAAVRLVDEAWTAPSGRMTADRPGPSGRSTAM
ncbi:hypothetical protein GCM10023335_50690 [Streptomyces siamensis]|uniref:Uncharacterized protein n=1 Tax=Streptomyces siamensis TaxID=1274986 RepID=A0ABP9J4U3_9ACTN